MDTFIRCVAHASNGREEMGNPGFTIDEEEFYEKHQYGKVRIEWENGDVLEDRVDVGSSKHDFRPQFISIGSYLKGLGVGSPPRGVMYGSSFQYDIDDEGLVTETTRDNVSWTD